MERKFTPDYEYANTVNQMVIETLKQKLGKENYIDIPLLHKDYAIISNVFESHSHNRKNKTNDVPHELIVSDCKYSVFVDINGSYGFYPRLSLRIRIINNETKKFEYDKPVQLQEFVRNEEYIKVNLIRQIKRVFNIKK
ncbi:MAG: hypothetical protein EOP00_33920 [Pedobacter sp.]|nr:MAG: hypothetical protein EOP00_33920 [Pedobacter sp.]